jgi:hypothetical protein
MITMRGPLSVRKADGPEHLQGLGPDPSRPPRPSRRIRNGSGELDLHSASLRGGAGELFRSCPRGRAGERRASRCRDAGVEKSHDPAAGRRGPSAANVERTVLDAEEEPRTPEETRRAAKDRRRGLSEPPSPVAVASALLELRAGWFGGGGLDPPFAARGRVRWHKRAAAGENSERRWRPGSRDDRRLRQGREAGSLVGKTAEPRRCHLAVTAPRQCYVRGV